MYARLRQGLSYGLCGDKVVFLDLAADHYFCLPAGREKAFVALSRLEGGIEWDSSFEPLAAFGVIEPSVQAEGFAPPTSIEVPTHDLVDCTGEGPSWHDLAGACAAELGTMLSLRTRRLADIVAEIEACGRGRAGDQRDRDSRLGRIAAAFAKTSFVFPAADRCLVRAVAMMRACHRRDLFPRLVFGVRLQPFSAHCWVQSGPSMLIGGVEQARLFTPVRVVG
ncbi:lasso peptide biosynthesis B2 protein [Sphingosinicella sp. CPCC 101087]|uniref:lasso peptide biosynthesis B2 protein n=1 Tax=Sphingosinicella sp. CPCC 101087 TaxID=2497754 RepID=UPI0013EC0DCF|nr:lasso peptide biosynthesis B2 protein [Sphingosinicella sp. CPCC 101087]